MWIKFVGEIFTHSIFDINNRKKEKKCEFIFE